MFCHVPHAQAAYAAAISGMKPAAQPLPLRLPRDSRAPHRRPSQSRISFLHPVPFRSVLSAAGPPRAAEPCFARNVRVRARAWPRAFRGGARFARLIAPACARAREAGAQAHHSRPFSKRCFFRAGAKRQREQPRAAAAPLLTAQSYHGFAGGKPDSGIISDKRTTRISRPDLHRRAIPAVSPPRWVRSGFGNPHFSKNFVSARHVGDRRVDAGFWFGRIGCWL